MAPINVIINNIPRKTIQGRFVTNPSAKVFTKTPISGPRFVSTNVKDARLMLIMKKRGQIRDARERLGQIAKTMDAREKLNKKKGFNTIINAGPMKKTVNTFRINQSKRIGGRTQMKGISLVRTVRSNPVNPSTQYSNVNVHRTQVTPSNNRYHPIAGNPTVVTIKNDSVSKPKVFRSQSTMRPPRVQAPRQQARSVSTPIRNDKYTRTAVRAGPMFASARPRPQPVQNRPRPIFVENRPVRMVASNNYMPRDVVPQYEEEYVYDAPHEAIPVRYITPKRQAYAEYEEYAPVKKQATFPSTVMSRLDQPKSTGSYGHKVLVTNLHSVVSNEDIEELFGNIGPVATARLIGKGTAEVVFFSEDDCLRSVDVYHNRQLDGQPMNVVKVSKPVMLSGSVTALSRGQLPSTNGSVNKVNLSGHQGQRLQPKSVLRTARGRGPYYM